MDGIRYFTTSLLIFSLVIISNIKKINADGILSIRLYDYNNTGSIKYDGRCCDGENIQSGECATDLCDYAIRICVTTPSLRQKCIPDRGQRKKFISVGTDFEPVFTFPSDTKNNRFQFDSWTEKATIEIEVTDLDGFDISSRTEAIDLFSLVYDRKSPLHRPPGTGDADYEEHILTGNRKTRPSQLRMGVAVHCLNNYYTDSCSKFCLPSNDCDGHYSCDNATGDKLCTRGWEGVNCSQPKSDETRCADTTYCHNGGTCAQTLYNPNQAYCCCPPGFTGTRCEMDIDECPMMPCVHGQCFNTMGSYTCTCDFGFDGKNCDHNNTCGEQPCFNGGKCRTVLIQRTYITHVCDCPQGFTGKYCQSEITTTTSSTTTTTTITLPTTTTTTTTLPSALGTTAAIVPTSDSTTSQPTTSTVTTSQRPQVHVTCNRDNYCRHKGECRNGTCICKPGFTGALCQIEIVECRSYPCQNGGRCRDGLGNYTCECTAGYKGKNCEIIEPETTTASPTVLNMDCKMCVHGTCKRDKNKSFCECQNGYSGRTCSVHEETKCGITEEAYCLKDNLCRINSRDRVACESDWKGLLCRNSTAYDANDPECPDISCKNDGHCYNGMCCCRDGFSGKYCEYEILHCMSSPCLNGGTCTNLFNDFECNCKRDFSGTMCEISLVSTTVTTHTPSIEHTSLPSSQFFTTEHTTLFRSSQHTTSSFQTTASPFQSTTSLLESTTSNLDSTTPHVESTTQKPQTTRSSSQSSQFPTAFTTSSSPTFTSSSESNPSTPVIHSTTNSDFFECSGLQQFLNGTTIDTSYGKTKCTCIVGIIASCETIELPHQTTPTPEPEKTTREQTTSRMVTSTTMGTSTMLKTTSAAPTVATSSSVPSTRTTKSPKVTTTPMVTTTEMVTTEISTPIKRANRTIVLDGKIPQKDMDQLEKLLNSVLENSNKGLNCSDVKILGSEYVYNITKHPFTSITFNASNCFNDSDANANKSFNTNLANALSSSSLFKDHNLNTGNPNQFGISYSLFLIGYVYEHNTEAIKKNIKKTWEDTGNSNIDVLIIHKEFYIGKYGTLITEILYLVAHGTSLIPADQARPPSDSQMQKVFMTKKPVMNNVYTHDVHLPYRNGIRMSLKTTTRTSQYSIGTARRAVVTNWKKYLTDSGMCSGPCDNLRIDFAPNEKSSNKVGIDSMDVVYFPTLNGNELEIVNNGVSRQLSKGVNLCNCKTTRQRYVDISGRVKLKEDAPVMEVLTNLTQGISDRVWSKEHLLTMEGDLVTRIYFLPNVPIKKSLNQWPNPNMDGLMDSYNKSLRVIDEKINSLTVRMLYTVVMKGSLASDKKTFVKKNLLDSIFAANPDIQSRDIGIDFHSWGTDFYSEKGGSATKIQYMVDVLQTDSSLVDFTKPGDNHLAVSFQNSNLDICNCVARSVRTLWIEERKDANASMIEKAIRNAWMKANKGVNVNISASVRRTENGFEGDEKGTKAKKILYYVSPKQGTTAVDEDDLDEPSNTMIKSELQNLVPGIKVYTHELKRQEAEESEWWIYLAIGLGVLAIIIIILISVLIAVRTYRHRQSETLKQDPKTVNGFSKEHFSKEPVMEKNSNGFYDYDDEDAKNHSSTYIVNS